MRVLKGLIAAAVLAVSGFAYAQNIGGVQSITGAMIAAAVGNVGVMSSNGSTISAANTWTSFTPVVTLTGGSGTSTSALVGSYSQSGKWLAFHASWTIAFTTAPTNVAITLPNSTTGSSVSAQLCTAANNSVTQSGAGYVNVSATSAAIFAAAGGQLSGSTGSTMSIFCMIEVQ